MAAFVWKAFRSIKFGLFLLALIGIACIRASLMAADPQLGAEAIFQARLHVTGAPWFLFLLLLFAVQLIVSTWPNAKEAMLLPWRRMLRRDADFYDKAVYQAALEADASRGGRAAVESALAGCCTVFRTEGGAFCGQRGIARRWGPVVVHAGILLVLLAGLAWA